MPDWLLMEQSLYTDRGMGMCETCSLWNSHYILTEVWECVGLASYGTVI